MFWEGKANMSSYTNMYSDFPSRCQQVWERIERTGQNGDRDLSVTAMLMAAAAGFATPWEHLRHNSTNAEKAWQGHPAFKDVSPNAYDRTLRQLSKQLSEPLLTSPFFQGEEDFCWTLGHCDKLKDVHDVILSGARSQVCLDTRDARFLLKVLRNALAHNNICAFGNGHGDIDRLSFFSEDVDYVENKKKVVGWHVASTTVEGFRSFLKQWFELIRQPALRLVLSESLESQDEMEIALNNNRNSLLTA